MGRPRISTILLLLAMVIGVCLLLYPTVADWYNSLLFNSAVDDYTEMVSTADIDTLDGEWQDALDYNAQVAKRGNYLGELEDEARREYNQQLSLTGEDMDMMGYLFIPKLRLTLPVYHSVTEAVLSSGIGHIEGTSLPVGGESSHSVLSGHRGLPSAKLLTDIDSMKEGDLFQLNVLGHTLTYEVDSIHVVLPEDLSYLQIEDGQDLCTLVTCTPYGVNSHRLLVRGHRVDNPDGDALVSADALIIEPYLVAPFVAIPLVIVVVVWLLTDGRRHKRSKFMEVIKTE